MCFSCFCHSKYHNINNSGIFLMMCTFAYGHLILVSIFYQLTSRKDQIHTGNLKHCRQTLQLFEFCLIKNMKGHRAFHSRDQISL